MNKIFFVLIHLSSLLVFFCGVSLTAVLACLALFYLRLFAITAGFHRLLSHRSYKTSRPFQFVLAALGTSAVQRGPIWWASWHRYHHKHADTTEDVHSPIVQGIWWAHVGWVLSRQKGEVNSELSKDLSALPELRLLDRWHYIPPLLLVGGCYVLGVLLQDKAPSLHTGPFQLVVWGMAVSTVLLYHATFAINSLAHLLGNRRFNTTDDSRNSFLLSILTLGEGWHNNHHRYPGAERQGYYWWEVDITHYILKVLSKLGLVWDLREPPRKIYEEAKTYRMELPSAAAAGHRKSPK